MSAHKFHGPKGIGALYCRSGIPLKSFIHGGAQERGKRAGTENVASIVGMAVALKKACEEMEENAKNVTVLRDRLIDELLTIPNSRLNGHRKFRLPGNVDVDNIKGTWNEGVLTVEIPKTELAKPRKIEIN